MFDDLHYMQIITHAKYTRIDIFAYYYCRKGLSNYIWTPHYEILDKKCLCKEDDILGTGLQTYYSQFFDNWWWSAGERNSCWWAGFLWEVMFTKKVMVNKQGIRNLQHPHFQRMRMRSKKARLGSGGIPCVSCDKIFNCDKTMEHYRKKFHWYLILSTYHEI